MKIARGFILGVFFGLWVTVIRRAEACSSSLRDEKSLSPYLHFPYNYACTYSTISRGRNAAKVPLKQRSLIPSVGIPHPLRSRATSLTLNPPPLVHIFDHPP